jgi:uracil-DNA glycosylase family protein
MSAADYLPERRTLKSLREAAAHCRGCELYRGATQTVFGEGPARARAMFVGEQPGDREDLAGRPFVGPAGTLLRDAMQQAGIAPRDVYLTNAVKHFKFVQRGKRRIHAKPKRIEINACKPWLETEIRAVRPQVVVALGATAALALFGPRFKLTAQRGIVMPAEFAPQAMATIHPSAILRSPDDATRHAELARFIDDLKRIAAQIRAAA